MPLQKLQFRPGINREGTDYSNEGGWYACDKVRFRSGFPEKIGGWIRLSNQTFLGICRALWNWVTLAGNNYLGVGTSKKYYIENGGSYYNITPFVFNSAGSITTTLTANPFSTTLGSGVVTVVDTVSDIVFSTGDYVYLTSTATVGGFTIEGEYLITNVITTTTYEITLPGAADATESGGGTVTAAYEYPVGNDVYTFNNGWGAGSWSPTITALLGQDPFSISAGSNLIFVTQNGHGYLYSAGSFVPNEQYKIVAVGTTDFTLIGASSNTVGTVFTATGIGTGNGTASIAWVSFSGVQSLTSTIPTYGFVGNVSLVDEIGFYGHADSLITNGYLNSTFEITYVNSNTYTVSLPSAVAGSFTIGDRYVIDSIGTTDFTLIGAASNTIGVSFVATGYGSGTGTAAITAVFGMEGGGDSVVVYPQFGSRPWGSAADVGVGQQLRLWTNDNFGEDLIIAPRGGPIFYWDVTTGLTVRAQYLSIVADNNGFDGDFVPNITNQIIGSAIQRFAIAFGSNPYDPTDPETPFDPLLVRWSDQENPFEWVPAATNQSGEYRLNIGSGIIMARSTRQEILVWTDAAIYSMQYLGPPYVWGFQLLQDNITIMSPNSAITINNITYWMGTDKFFMYSGRVETLPCTLWQYVFDDINKNQAFQVFAGSNESYSEIWWFYASQESNAIDKYIIYNYVERTWAYGSMTRSAWLDSGLRQYPIAADTVNNRLLYHEANVDDVSGLAPVPIDAFIQSSDFDIGDGHNFGFVWRILPDVTFNGSNVNQPYVTMTVRPRRNSGAPYGLADNPPVASGQNYANRGTYDVQEFDGQVYTRLRGRQLSFRIESTTLGVAWQLGTPRIDIRNDGRR
jgi:hypothetical protein